MTPTLELTNEGCREQALANAKIGNYRRAMRWYNSAAARTIGHKKSESYEQLSRGAAEMGGFKWSHEFATLEDWADIKFSWEH